MPTSAHTWPRLDPLSFSISSTAAGSRAREALDEWLSDIVTDDTAMQVRLAASELISNAVRPDNLNETDTIALTGTASEKSVRIEVQQPT
jgi:anti-sigma regulatory factor (Ser/Thr protein kinase)